MKTVAKQLLISALALSLIFFSIAAWAAIKVVAWARDLPNRIVIDLPDRIATDGDGLGNAFASAVVQSYHDGLLNGNTETQCQIIRDFTSFVYNNAAAQEWIRTEYYVDLQQLSSSPNADVADLATALLTSISEPVVPDGLQPKTRE